MTKEAYVTIRIKRGQDDYLEVGEKLDLPQFTKDQLKSLYDAGAIEIRDVPDPEPVKGPETKTEEPKKDAK